MVFSKQSLQVLLHMINYTDGISPAEIKTESCI